MMCSLFAGGHAGCAREPLRGVAEGHGESVQSGGQKGQHWARLLQVDSFAHSPLHVAHIEFTSGFDCFSTYKPIYWLGTSILKFSIE